MVETTFYPTSIVIATCLLVKTMTSITSITHIKCGRSSKHHAHHVPYSGGVASSRGLLPWEEINIRGDTVYWMLHPPSALVSSPAFRSVTGFLNILINSLCLPLKSINQTNPGIPSCFMNSLRNTSTPMLSVMDPIST
jgi:hypothetical protein